jgi:chorismate mutase
LTAISETKVNIKIEEVPKITTTEVILKVLREIHAKIIEVSFKEKIIPKTFSSIIPRDIRSITDQDISPRTI